MEEQLEQESSASDMRKMQKSIGCIVLGGLILAVPIAWFVLSFTAEARDAGHRFVDALREGDHQAAYEMCSPELQNWFASLESFSRQVKPESLPDSWWWTSAKISGSTAQLSYSSKSWSEKSGLTVRLQKEEGQWRVTYLSAGNSKGTMKLQVPPKK